MARLLNGYDLAEQRIKQKEGFSAKAYLCPANKMTIGWGFNIEDVSMSTEALEVEFTHRFYAVVREVHGIFPQFDTYSPNRQAAIIDVVYNLGASRFLKFKNTIAAIKNGRWDEAADELLDSEYAKRDVPVRAKENAELLRGG